MYGMDIVECYYRIVGGLVLVDGCDSLWKRCLGSGMSSNIGG